MRSQLNARSWEVHMLTLVIYAALACGHHSTIPHHAPAHFETTHEFVLPPRLTDAQRAVLAASMSDAFLSCGYLRVNARIIHQGKELLVRSDMTCDKLRVEAFRDNALIAAFAVNGDRVQEYRPLLVPSEDDFAYRNVVVEFDKLEIVHSETSVGSAMLLEPDISCEFGTLMESWLDPATDRASWWSDRVLGGVQLEDQTIEGVRCLVFHELVTTPANEERGELTIKNTVYIDPDSFLPVRWDTSQSTSEYSIERERYYEFVRTSEAPQNISWMLDPKQLQNAVPPGKDSTATARSKP